MRILHTADWHLGKSLEGHSRIEEQEQFLQEFVRIVEDTQPDLILIAGDVYDSVNPPAKAEQLFYGTLKKLSENGERLLFIIAGNHDNPDRLVAAGPLAAEHGIIMQGLPKNVIPVGDYGQHRVLESGEGYVEIEIRGEKAVILSLPYPSEKRLNEVLFTAFEEEEVQVASYGERIARFFAEREDKYREDTVNLAITHLFAMDSEQSGSERGIQLGGSYLIDGSCLPKKAQYVALGHVHKAQAIPHSERRAWYAGAPIHYHSSEIATGKNPSEKSCYLIDVKAGEEPEIKKLPFSIYKPIEKWHCSSIEAAIERCKENTGRSAWVYLEIETDRYIQEDEIRQMRKYKEDIIEIYPLLQRKAVKEDRKRMEEKNFTELFEEFYEQVRGTKATEEVTGLLLEVLEKEKAE